jgi:hypothetical protein
VYHVGADVRFKDGSVRTEGSFGVGVAVGVKDAFSVGNEDGFGVGTAMGVRDRFSVGGEDGFGVGTTVTAIVTVYQIA